MQEAGAEDCKSIETDKNFDLDSYISAPWYPQYMKEQSYQKKAEYSCTKAEYHTKKNNLWGWEIDVENSNEDKNTFLINCESVKYGFFGNLAVISKTAFGILTANMDTCYTDTVGDWKVGIEHGKHGPMREDINNWGNEVAIAGFQIIAMT